MELQFEKTAWECLRPAVSQAKNEEHTLEVRLTEALPDIGRVLAAWGQVLLRGKEWRDSGMTVSAGVMAWVLYQPEDGGAVQSVECWIPFQTRWDFPKTQRDGTIWVSCGLRSIDARSLSARKLMVRAAVSLMGEALEPVVMDVYSPGQVPEDVQLLRNHYPVRLPREAGEKGFAIEEELSVPASVGQMEQVIRWELRPEIVDRKVMAGKVVFRGSAHGHVLFRDADGGLKTWDFEIPFSQFEDLQREYGPEAEARIIPAVTGMELERTAPETVTLKAGMVGQYVITDRSMLETVGDAYSNSRQVTPQTEELFLPAVLDDRMLTVKMNGEGESDGQRILDAAFLVGQPSAHRENDAVDLEISGAWQVLTLDREGRIQGQVLNATHETDIEADRGSRVAAVAVPTGTPQAELAGNRVHARSEVLLDTFTIGEHGIPMVTGLELGEAEKADPNRPSMILRRCGTARLWELAKGHHSTVEAIREINGLEGEPEPGRMLLIPVVV